MHEALIREQQAYYCARAGEYAASRHRTQTPIGHPECVRALRSLHQLGSCDDVLELAGGNGLWTAELARIARRVTVLDGSREMLALNRAANGDERVTYHHVDLFAWQPDREYDLVFFSFWISHVPRDLLDAFLDKVQRAVRPGGSVFLVDEPAGGSEASGPNQRGMYQTRHLRDGRSFKIVKVFYEPSELEARLTERGFASVEVVVGDDYFHLSARRGAAATEA